MAREEKGGWLQDRGDLYACQHVYQTFGGNTANEGSPTMVTRNDSPGDLLRRVTERYGTMRIFQEDYFIESGCLWCSTMDTCRASEGGLSLVK